MKYRVKITVPTDQNRTTTLSVDVDADTKEGATRQAWAMVEKLRSQIQVKAVVVAPVATAADIPFEAYRAKQNKAREIVRTRQQAGNLVTIRELALTLHMRQELILNDLIPDMELSYNCGYERDIGDYTVEDLGV